ncbi:serine/arginine repetitive matrix protein 1-like [Teleopsis dalmanni]|uniref:serine/arginine repetitive matrix protein 1-like n=1 Tax=Teleopsis dalmanni TaxID=139649 RepID=UPI0018CCD568|nr:serine/arginine repetitive matrix protein 1-like [Teleopsis dalmanni]
MDNDNEINGEESKKNQMSPSSTESEIKLPGNDMVVSNRKGVLDLYDDSDWEELDIDKPKEYMKQTDSKEPKKATEEQQAENEKADEADDTTIAPDRSYTPCLDENNEPEENANTSPLKEITTKEATPKPEEKEINGDNTPTANNLVEIETELISEEEENVRSKNKRRSDKHDTNKETFKKVSNKQKIRNYRSEKQFNKRNDKRRYSRSTSKSRSRSRSKSFSRSKSPRGRGRKRTRSPFYNRSNKENHNYRHNNRDWDDSGRNNMGKLHRQRPKRREMPRYDVRNIIGTQRTVKDRYGRDTSRQLRNSRSASRERRLHSFSRSRTSSLSPRRNRRSSFSMSPTPPGVHRISISPRRFASPPRHYHSPRRFTPPRQRARSTSRLRSRSISPLPRMNNRKVIRHMRNVSPNIRSRSRARSFSPSPRYTPRLSRSRSKSPFNAVKSKKKKTKDRKKKKNKKRALSLSPETNRRISRQQDPFIENAPPKKKRHVVSKNKSPVDEQTWSPSPSPPPPLLNYERERENNISWTPPITTNRISQISRDDYAPVLRRSSSILSKKEKRKRTKKKKKTEKRKDTTRKDKRRQRRTKTPEPAPSKEVFASGNNILVSVSFNKETTNQQPQQTTVVTLPPTREDLLTSRRISIDHAANANAAKKRKEKPHKRKKIDAKPIAIIDLDRSPFQIHQEPTDVIILTDSEDGRENEREQRRERRQSIQSVNDNIEHRQQLTTSARVSVQHEQTPPLERLETIMEESYELQQTGPKTPPEPPIVKFNINSKKQNKIRINPLHDEQEMQSETESQERPEQDEHRQDVETIHTHNNQKIGPNTPPDSGPCSPDAYDPFEPTKSPSMSPRSPSPAPIDTSQNSISECGADGISQKHVEEQRHSGERNAQQISGGTSSGITTQSTTMNPVELVMALMNTKVNNSQDLANKSNESQYTTSTHMLSSGVHGSTHDDNMGGMREKSDDNITVISNVLISTCVSQQSQHIPSISSPTPPVNKTSQVLKLPLPKVGGSVGSSSGVGLPAINNNVRNGTADDIFNINDTESPYSPGSADYEDLFEPPPDTNSKRRTKRAGKGDVFDNLFGSSSPVNALRLPTYTPSRKQKQNAYGVANKNKSKGGFEEVNGRIYLIFRIKIW